MKKLFEEYGELLLITLISFMMIMFFVSIFIFKTIQISGNTLNEYTYQNINYQEKEKLKIKTFKVKDILIRKGEEINYLDKSEALNNRGDFFGGDEDIRDYISIYNNVDNNLLGSQDIIYVIRYNGESRFIKAKLIVIEKEEV